MKKSQEDYFGLVFISVCIVCLILSVIALVVNIYCLATGNCKETCTCTIETKSRWSE